MEPREAHKTASVRRPLRLLHTADLHLGSDDYPAEAIQGLHAVVEAACRHSPDALLIAGDLFDSQRISPETASYAFQSLGGLACPVIIVPGNHDTLLTSLTFHKTLLPANIRVLLAPQGEMAIVEPLDLAVWGRPVYDHAPEFRPLGGLEPRPKGGWYVAIAHGLVISESANEGRSSPISQRELAGADCDYIALGHVHQFRHVGNGNAPAYYSGAPSGTRDNTVVLVHLDPLQGVSVQPIRL
ncbi:MAG: DNA repair exonuclease [Chloroflexi bacterium]|nr:DNA repair exonuclease [Chloroflexota bacterium]